MHIVPFTLKRAHLVSQKLLQGFAIQAELTPARFDLILVLQRSRFQAPFQSFLAKWLGVSRATVCKMVRRMREAGMVELSVDPEDRRRRRISLTLFGRRCYRRLDKMRHRGKIAAAVRFAWCTACLSRAEVRLCMAEIVEHVRRYCRGLNDHTTMFTLGHVRGYGYD
jgi:DNA-binding MarR family transcriptional regulator